MKRLVTSIILGTMIISTASMSFANAKPMEKITFATKTAPAYELTLADELEPDVDGDWEIDWTDLDEADYGDYEMPSFDEFMKESKDYMKPIDKATEDKLEGLYKDAVKLEEAEKYEEAMKSWDNFYDLFDSYVDETKLEDCIIIDGDYDGDWDDMDFEPVSFDDFMKDIKDYVKDIPSKDMAKLKELYEAGDKYLDEEKFEEADKTYDAFDDLLDKYLKDEVKMTELEEGDYDGDFEMPSYDDFMKAMSEFLKGVSKDDNKALETLYNKAVANEKEGKYEDADADWAAFDKILDKYFKDEVKMQ